MTVRQRTGQGRTGGMLRPLIAALLVVAGLAHAQADAGLSGHPTVAVLYFDVPDKQEELQVFRKGLAQMLITDLVAEPRLRVVERDRLEDVQKELNLSSSGRVEAATAQQMGRLLGAKYQVMGSIVPLGKAMSFETKVVVVETGQVIRTTRAVASVDDVFAAEQQLAQALLKLIAEAEGLRPTEKVQRSPAKVGYATAVKYAKALDAKDRKDTKAAVQMLSEVVKAQPDFILAKVDLLNLTK